MHRVFNVIIFIADNLRKSSYERHELIAKGLEYVIDSNKAWWTLLGVASVLYITNNPPPETPVAFEISSLVMGAFLALITATILIAFKTFNGPINLTFIDIIWEGQVWLGVVDIIGGFFHTKEFFIYALLRTLTWILYTYLLIDTQKPPRKRKKIKIPKVLAEKRETIITT